MTLIQVRAKCSYLLYHSVLMLIPPGCPLSRALGNCILELLITYWLPLAYTWQKQDVKTDVVKSKGLLISLRQWLSNVRIIRIPSRTCKYTGFWAPAPELVFSRPGWGQRICISAMSHRCGRCWFGDHAEHLRSVLCTVLPLNRDTLGRFHILLLTRFNVQDKMFENHLKDEILHTEE